MLFFFFYEVSYAHQGYMYLLTNTEMLIHFKITVFYVKILYKKSIPVEFSSAITPDILLWSSVSHDPSEILLIC